MNISYFLGANSKDGFYSLYNGFAVAPGDFLHIVKGGPGTGKSAFMRRIGKAAEERGLDVTYVLCSGDPDSLDGVYITQMHAGWADGTAPHVAEPRLFGADSDYVNLGQFCDMSFDHGEKAEIKHLNADYKAEYARAYAYLHAAAAEKEAGTPQFFKEKELETVKKRICSIVDRHAIRSTGDGSRTDVFISAISCQGIFSLTGALYKLCKQFYVIENSFDEAHYALDFAAEAALDRGCQVIVCRSPLCPEETEAVLLPDSGLAFINEDIDPEAGRHLHFDTLVPPELRRACRAELRGSKKAEDRALSLAVQKLINAKSLHDRLESIYHPHMDFAALTEYTDAYISKLF